MCVNNLFIDWYSNISKSVWSKVKVFWTHYALSQYQVHTNLHFHSNGSLIYHPAQLNIYWILYKRYHAHISQKDLNNTPRVAKHFIQIILDEFISQIFSDVTSEKCKINVKRRIWEHPNTLVDCMISKFLKSTFWSKQKLIFWLDNVLFFLHFFNLRSKIVTKCVVFI